MPTQPPETTSPRDTTTGDLSGDPRNTLSEGTPAAMPVGSIPRPPSGAAPLDLNSLVAPRPGVDVHDTMAEPAPAVDHFLPYVDPKKALKDDPSAEELWATPSQSKIKNRETISSTMAARGCMQTDLPEEQVTPFFVKLGLKYERRGSLWMFYGRGERVASTFADLNTEISEISNRSGNYAPRVYFDTYPSDNQNPLDSQFAAIAPHMLERCTTGSAVVSKEFHTLLDHPRVQIYISKVEGTSGRIQGKDIIVLSEFKSVINELRAGGAEQQYGREEEMNQMFSWISKFMSADVPMFSSFTVHGDAMMGKTRIAEETIKKIREVQQKLGAAPGVMAQLRQRIQESEEAGVRGVTGLKAQLGRLEAEFAALPKNLPYVIFVPAKDTRMGDPCSFFKTYAKQVLAAARDVFVGDTLPSSCLDLERIDSLDPTELAQQGPEILALALRRLRRSGNRFLILTDDMQWADSESCNLLRRTFSQDRQADNKNFGHIALLNLTRTGDQVINQELLKTIQSAPNAGDLTLKPLPFLTSDGENAPPMPLLVSFVYGLLNVDPAVVSIDASIFDRLARAAGGVQGNPGLLTEMVRSMRQEGVLTITGTNVTCDDRFLAWTTMGEADAMAAARIDRLLENPLQSEVLRYIVFLRETGDCDFRFIRNFFLSHLKRPDLFLTFGRLCEQGVFNLQKIEEGIDDLAIVGFARDPDERRLRSVFSNPATAGGEDTAGAYREVARYLFFTREKLSRALTDDKNQGNKSVFLAIIDRCSPHAIFAMASKGHLLETVQEYVIDAFKDAYARGQYDLALEVYEYIESDPNLVSVLSEFNDSKNIDLQLDLIQCMHAKKVQYTAEIEALGYRVRTFYARKAKTLTQGSIKLNGVSQNQMFSSDDRKRIDRLHDLMCDFYFLRAFDKGVREGCVAQLNQWSQGLAGYLPERANEIFSPAEIRFMDIKNRFYKMCIDYVQAQYSEVRGNSGDFYNLGRQALLREFPEFENDIRFKRVDLQANRIMANAHDQEWNITYPMSGGTDVLVYDDGDAADLAAIFPGNSFHAMLEKSSEYFVKFLETAHNHPELVPDRTQVYRSQKTLAVIEGRLGHTESAMSLFFDARSDAIKLADTERFAEILLNMSSPLPKLIQYYQTTKDPAARDQILRTAQLIARNEPGAVLSNTHSVNTASYFILQWAAHYARTAAASYESLGNAGYYDVSVVNLLGAVSVAAETASSFGEVIDEETNYASGPFISVIKDAISAMTKPIAARGGKYKGESFLDAHRHIDDNRKPDDYWSFYAAPFLASLMNNMSRLDSYPELHNIVMAADPSKATFADAIPALAREMSPMVNDSFPANYGTVTSRRKDTIERPHLRRNIPQYAAVLKDKIANLAIVDQRVKALFPTLKGARR